MDWKKTSVFSVSISAKTLSSLTDSAELASFARGGLGSLVWFGWIGGAGLGCLPLGAGFMVPLWITNQTFGVLLTRRLTIPVGGELHCFG